MAAVRNRFGVPLDFKGFRWSKIIDAMVGAGSVAQGDILSRTASAWARLAAGTSGRFLKTQGAAADPTWATAVTSSGDAFYCAQAATLEISNNAVFQNTDLVMTLTAGTWAFQSVWFTTSSSSGGMETELDYTGTVTSVSHQRTRWRVAAGFTMSLGNTTLPLTVVETVSDNEWHHILGAMVVSTGGDLRVRVRQTTANGTVTIRFFAGNFLRALQL